MKKIFLFFTLCVFSLNILAYKAGENLCGGVMWGQDTNNVGGCSPSYNFYIESGNDDCVCNKKSVGCGAVAAGKVFFVFILCSYNLKNNTFADE